MGANPTRRRVAPAGFERKGHRWHESAGRVRAARPVGSFTLDTPADAGAVVPSFPRIRLAGDGEASVGDKLDAVDRVLGGGSPESCSRSSAVPSKGGAASVRRTADRHIAPATSTSPGSPPRGARPTGRAPPAPGAGARSVLSRPALSHRWRKGGDEGATAAGFASRERGFVSLTTHRRLGQALAGGLGARLCSGRVARSGARGVRG